MSFLGNELSYPSSSLGLVKYDCGIVFYPEHAGLSYDCGVTALIVV